jgi:hypothetical protein
VAMNPAGVESARPRPEGPACGRPRRPVSAPRSANRPKGPQALRPETNRSGRIPDLRDRVRRGSAKARRTRPSGRSPEHRTTPRPRPVPGPPGDAPPAGRGARPSYVPLPPVPPRRRPCHEPFGGRSHPLVADDRLVTPTASSSAAQNSTTSDAISQRAGACRAHA